jgi:hypothetical protein
MDKDRKKIKRIMKLDLGSSSHKMLHLFENKLQDNLLENLAYQERN